MSTTYDHQALEAFMPHRGVNMLPDTLEMDDDGKRAVSRATIPVDDPRGRRLFARADGHGGQVWIEPFLGELMALTGIPLLKARLDAAGQVAVFSSMNKITFPATARMEAAFVGEAVITRERGPFTQFTACLRCGDDILYQGEIMSGMAAMADVAGQPVQVLAQDGDEEPLQADFSGKAAGMRFIDAVRSCDVASGHLVGVYRYPEDHPLVPGHFPEAALMMGMAQWTAVIDAAWEAKARCGLHGPIQVDGRIVRPDGSLVLDLRGMDLDDADGVPRVLGTKRLAFRDPIRPGDGILIEVDVRSC